MSEALYERYKDALRRGHVAALRGRSAAALEAYGEAAKIAPDRPLPLVGIGGVLTRLGKHSEALAAYDAALERAASDEGALRGRAEALTLIGDRAGAADAFDRLATALDTGGRLPDAADAARRALELAESRARRSMMRGLVARLAALHGDPAAAEALALASSILQGGSPTTRAARPKGGSGVDGAAAGADIDREAVDAATSEAEPEPTSVPEPEAFDPVRAIGEVEAAVQGDDPAAARDLALAAAAGHRAAAQPSTAIDACYMALAGSPADPGLHLALAELYLDQGWRPMAVEKLILLSRLAELTDDATTREAVCAVVAARLPDESRLTARCA